MRTQYVKGAAICFFLTFLCLVVLFCSFCYGQDVKSKTLSWTAPTHNTDGSLITDLAGYNVYASASDAGPWDKAVCTQASPLETRCSWPIPLNVEKRVFVYVTAFDNGDPVNESDPSNIVSVNVNTITPNSPSELQIIVISKSSERVLIIER